MRSPNFGFFASARLIDLSVDFMLVLAQLLPVIEKRIQSDQRVLPVFYPFHLPSDVSPSARFARMLPIGMAGAHVLLDQLPVLEHAGASVAAVSIAFGAFMDFATFAVEFLKFSEI